jgi:monothiol glutaredoxin
MSIQERIKETVESNKVVVYMKGTPMMPQCGFSAATVQVLQQLGVPFASVNVLADPEVRDGIKQFTNWPTIPQLFIDGKFVGGCDIVKAMYASGELKKALEAAGMQPK